MRPRAAGSQGPGELEHVEAVVRAAFSTRRKTLANALRGGGAWSAEHVVAALEGCGIDPAVRAERVAAERFLALARALPRREAWEPDPR
jgi:16S rRNA (adenine1518-N6/adenine1519-N6)-dimethyltransferase